MNIEQLKARRSQILAEAKGFERQVASADESRARELELLFSGAMAEIESIDAEIREIEEGELPATRKPDQNPPVRSSAPSTEWRDATGRPVPVLGPDERMADTFRDHTSNRDEQPGFGGLVRSLALGPKSDAERRALAEGATASGGVTVPEPLAANFIDRMRAESVVFRAGAQTIPMASSTLKIARLDTDPNFQFRAENAAISDADPAFSGVTFTAKTAACIVKASRELLEDSVNLDQIMMAAFAGSASELVDRVAMQGGSGSEPTGILETSGISEILNVGQMSDYDPLIDALYELELANAPGPYTAVMHPRDWRTLRKLKTGLSGDLTTLVPPPEVQAMAKFASTGLSTTEGSDSPPTESSAVIGHFPHLLIGIRTELRVDLLRERYADAGQYAFVAWLRMDCQLQHKKSFCALKGIL